MKKIQRLKKKYNNFLYDHYRLKRTLREINGSFFAILAAFIFAFGFCCFTSPIEGITDPYFRFVTGGVSGISQNIALLLLLFGVKLPETVVTAIGYTCLNIPILIFSPSFLD